MWNDALSYSLVMILLSLSILSFLFAAARKEKAFWIFSAGYASSMISFMLFPAQGHMTPWVGIISANVTFMFFHFCMAWGIRVFYSFSRPWPIRFTVYYTVFSAFLIVFTFKYPIFACRAVIFSFFVIFMTVEFLTAVAHGIREFPRKIRYPILIFISSAIVFHAVRIVLALISYRKMTLFMNASPITTFTYTATILITILWAGSLIMIDNIRLMNDMRVKNSILENLAMKDELTGAFNRHFLDQTMHAEMERQDRYHMPLSIIMIDIDHFKSINDGYGHDVGDIVLTETAHRFSDGIRETDFLFRWGGEEFFILMPHTDITGAVLLAEKLRKMIADTRFTRVGTVTASFGVAERKKGEPQYEVFRRIDQALYRAKNNGRNRVEIQTEYAVSSVSVRIEWNRDWECGNHRIDSAHKKLIQMGNEILNLSISQASRVQVVGKLDILINHIKSHFAEEEEILVERGYPGAEDHATIHENLLSEARIFHEKFLAGECDSSLTFNFIVNRLIVDHLLSADVLFFPYMKALKQG